MKLDIRLDRSLDSAEQARTILGRVFALNATDLLDSVPDYWRGSLKDQLIYDPLQKQEAEFRWQPPPFSKPAPTVGPGAIEDHHGADGVGPSSASVTMSKLQRPHIPLSPNLRILRVMKDSRA